MAKAYSIDLRKRVFDFVEAGHSCHQAAAHFSTSVSFVVNLMRHVWETKSLHALARRRLRHSKLAPHSAFLLAQVALTLSACDLVILDNLPAHRNKAIEQVVQFQRSMAAVFAALFAIPPDQVRRQALNPIEMAFSKLKPHLRNAAATTIDALRKAVGQICDLFSPEECANFCKKAGYRFN